MRRRNAALRNGVTACLRELLGRLLDLLLGRLAGDAGQFLRGLDLRVGIAGVAADRARDRRRTCRRRASLQLGELVGAELALQAGEPAGERGQRVGVGAALGDVVEQLLQRRRRLAIERVGIGLVLLADADGIHDDEAVLRPWRWA